MCSNKTTKHTANRQHTNITTTNSPEMCRIWSLAKGHFIVLLGINTFITTTIIHVKLSIHSVSHSKLIIIISSIFIIIIIIILIIIIVLYRYLLLLLLLLLYFILYHWYLRKTCSQADLTLLYLLYVV